jgi:phytoene dehydrogenase-like protein
VTNTPLPTHCDVVIVGAGLAGLVAARVLEQNGIAPLLLESSDGVGGRVRSDIVDGFILDRELNTYLSICHPSRFSSG